eukprot:g3063.t1
MWVLRLVLLLLAVDLVVCTRLGSPQVAMHPSPDVSLTAEQDFTSIPLKTQTQSSEVNFAELGAGVEAQADAEMGMDLLSQVAAHAFYKACDVKSPQEEYDLLAEIAQDIGFPAALATYQDKTPPPPKRDELHNTNLNNGLDNYLLEMLKKSARQASKTKATTTTDKSNLVNLKEQTVKSNLVEMKEEEQATVTTTTPDKFDAAQKFQKESDFADLPFPDQLYNKLNTLFGNKDTLLTMEWPGRVLDQKTFEFWIRKRSSTRSSTHIQAF